MLAQQQLAKARQQSYLTKIFRLTTAQARRLYERGLLAARPDFFTVPVDSFLTDSAAPRRLPLGYYLVAHTAGPELVYWLRAETSRTVEVIDNQSDLSLTVRDSLARLRPDARVAVAGRPLAYDPATHTYRHAHGGRPGLVAVTADGRTTFHPLAQPARGARGRWALRAGRRVLYGRPLGYLTVPVWHLAHDLKHASRASAGLVGLLRSPFSEGLRDQRRSQRADHQRARWLSYLVVSQPRYRPTGDTLRLKARVLRRGSGRPATQPLTLWLGGGGLGRRKRLATLRPVRPGSYEYALPLTDTLGLRVGTRADLYLADGRERPAAEGSFRLEDYELKNNHYALRLLAREPWRGQPQAVFMRGSDANELNLPDARGRLAVLPAAAPGPLPTRRLFVPDTLWTHAQALDPLGETRVNLPPSIFPDVDLSYSVQATFLTSDNERHVETVGLPYRRDPGRLVLELGADSVRLRFDSLGVSRPHRARLRMARAGYAPGDSATDRWVRLPLALPLHLRAISYELRDRAGRVERLTLDEANAGLLLRSDRTDSLRLAVDNPHHLAFWYTAQILATIGPDLLVPGTGEAARVRLSGSPALPAGPVGQFPLALTLPAGTGSLTLRKQGGRPVYATAYQTRWNPTPAAVARPFAVATTLAGQAGRRVALPAGKPVELVVTVNVRAEARYVLLEVPIPAGCSYGDPAPTNYLEAHREYLRHQAGIFIDRLPVGRHTFRVALQPRYRGSYTLNPAKAELVYFPTKFGRTSSKRVVVR